MIDGFNEGWIDFEYGEANSRKERTTLEAVLRSLSTPTDIVPSSKMGLDLEQDAFRSPSSPSLTNFEATCHEHQEQGSQG